MEETIIKKYKSKLEALELELERQIAEYRKPVDFGSDIDSGDEEADETEEADNRLTIANDLHERLNQVKVALEKIGEGKYGACEKCGNEISAEILDIDPESRFCKNCKN